MKAIILAAGMGSRLLSLTMNQPKPLLEIGPTTIIGRLVNQFRELGIKSIIIVVGYKKDLIKSYFAGDQDITIIEYEDYHSSNNLYTLWSIKEILNEDLIISFADLIMDNCIIRNLISHDGDIVLSIHTKSILASTMRVQTKNNLVKTITSTKKEDATGNFIGIAKFSKKGCNILNRNMEFTIRSKDRNLYYTSAIDRYVRNGGIVNAVDIEDSSWVEVDNISDYTKAKNTFTGDKS